MDSFREDEVKPGIYVTHFENSEKAADNAKILQTYKDVAASGDRALIDPLLQELENSLFHLRRSQTELYEFLKESPEDVDILESISENIDAIALKEERVNVLKAVLDEPQN